MYKLVLIFTFVYLQYVECAKILGVFIIPSISHQCVFQPIWKELSLRGHEVTVLTPNPLKDPTLVNLTEIDLEFTYEILRKSNLQDSMTKEQSMLQIINNMYKLLGDIAEAELSHPPVQSLIKDKNKKFDVMLVEFLHPAMYALSARFNCPMIGITSLGTFIVGHDAVGNPSHPGLNPDLLLPFMGSLGFFERLYSMSFAIWYRLYYYYYIIPQQDKVARKYISENLPYLGDIERNVSMLFLNVNPIIHPIRPNVPAIVELGKMHIQVKKPLPPDLQKELDASKEGVIYFSLGSNVRSANMSEELREKVIGALSELPYKVFWKWEDDYLPNQPKNVITRKWFPQQDVLNHRNIKVFLTQGGLQSMEEAISSGVPLVGMPFFGDQPLNVMKMVHLGIAKGIDIQEFTKDELKEALIEVAENPKYRNKVKEISNLLSDVPMTGLEKAVWWTEYVIRHKGARHLRSPAVDMSIYQYLFLDVIAFVLAVTVLSSFILYKITVFSFKLIRKSKTGAKQKTS
ncbi:hypothetical protein ILUMI_13475 [Ignelater luminosus]|uniref:UDP-glucuronosyltransferase n=1 Tax=Ignelater luminosus TaxID=2038154 RepID=A0A8K0CS90_IGNLU|nr:hypothetical protein ILUMI_13475 [Ignelater luminosus]